MENYVGLLDLLLIFVSCLRICIDVLLENVGAEHCEIIRLDKFYWRCGLLEEIILTKFFQTCVSL